MCIRVYARVHPFVCKGILTYIGTWNYQMAEYNEWNIVSVNIPDLWHKSHMNSEVISHQLQNMKVFRIIYQENYLKIPIQCLIISDEINQSARKFEKTSAISRQTWCRLTIFTFLACCEIGSRFMSFVKYLCTY